MGIMTRFTPQDFFVVDIVEISVNFDHLTMTIWKIRRFYAHGHGRTPLPLYKFRSLY
jgi:hypothetical protein